MKNVVDMGAKAKQASDLLKGLANPDRLTILCNLAAGEKCVSDLEDILRIRQPTLSQQLSRLRADRLVQTRRNGKMIYYRLASTEAGRVIELLYELFCAPKSPKRKKKAEYPS